MKKQENELVSDFQAVLEKANYVAISSESLQRALQETSIIKLKTKVDFADFDQVLCYCRGDIYKIVTVRKFLKKEKEAINTFERVVLLIKFKDEAYFHQKGVKRKSLMFTPGKMYIYFYKNIPKFDLELLFPNIQISMTWKDRLLFGVPAVGAAIPVILKALPKLALIVGAIFFFVFGSAEIFGLAVDEKSVRDFMPVLAATLSAVIALGSFAVSQYNNYKNKLIRFRKNITDTLFFKNLANNANVFHALIDAAEEEECKEIILAYYHLLTSHEPLTAEQLDRKIEQWMNQKFEVKINFDIQGPIDNLESIRRNVILKHPDKADKVGCTEVALLKKDAQGRCQVLPLDEAKALVDSIWDNIFLYTYPY